MALLNIDNYVSLCDVCVNQFDLKDKSEGLSRAMGALWTSYDKFLADGAEGNFTAYAKTAINNALIRLYNEEKSKATVSIEGMIEESEGGELYIEQLTCEDTQNVFLEFIEDIKAFRNSLEEADRAIFDYRDANPDSTLKETVEALVNVPGVPRSQGGLTKRLAQLRVKLCRFMDYRC